MESFEEVSAAEEVGDGYCSGNKQLTDCDCSESSGKTCIEKVKGKESAATTCK